MVGGRLMNQLKILDMSTYEDRVLVGTEYSVECTKGTRGGSSGGDRRKKRKRKRKENKP
jgi:hypothetical protein